MDVAVNLAVSEQADFAAALAAARDLGMDVTQSFDDLGIISGRVDRDKLPSLARIPGVEVDPDREVGIQAG